MRDCRQLILERDMKMAKYRKKPDVIEAEQYRGQPIEGVIIHPKTGKATIDTLEGVSWTVQIGDWVLTGIRGEKYPCKPDIFEATYEKV
jgi:hypothetical protein